MAKRFTEIGVERQREPGIVYDAAQVGLGLKTSPTGKKVWIAQLTYPGHKTQTRRSLGNYPGLSLTEARAKAAKWYSLVGEGIDPAEAEREEREQREAVQRAKAVARNNTFGKFAEHYIAGRTNRRATKDAGEIRRLAIPDWGDKPLAEILPRDVRTLIDQVKVRAPFDAKNLWTHLSQIFKLAVHEELIFTSPMASLDRRLVFSGVDLNPRQRVLDDDELLAFLRATARMGYPAGPALRLILLTACRLGEIVEARWQEVHPELRRVLRQAKSSNQGVDWAELDDKWKLLTIPEQRYKTGQTHLVPLSYDACRILESLPINGAFLFSINGKSPFWLGSKHKAHLDRRMTRTLRALARTRDDDASEVTLARFVTHDLRRTARTGLASLGVSEVVAETTLGHARSGIAGTYDRHKYLEEVRAALEAWASRLRSIAEESPTAPRADYSVVALADAR